MNQLKLFHLIITLSICVLSLPGLVSCRKCGKNNLPVSGNGAKCKFKLKRRSTTTSSSSQDAPKSNSKPQKSNSSPLIQEDFLVTPADFEKDEDVCYLVKQLHRPQVIEKFYTSAQLLHSHLPHLYAELQTADQKVAERFLVIMKKLATASLKEPLTVTNLIFAFGKHIYPLFKFRSEPLVGLVDTLKKLDTGQDRERRLIFLMTQFFENFTLPEVTKIQDFIKLMSLSTMTKDENENESNTHSITTHPKTHHTTQQSTTNSTTQSATIINSSPIQFLDISKTSLEFYAERIRLTLTNAISKMIILLDLFLTDPSVANRSKNLVKKLWDLHLHRLALREDTPFEDLDLKWLDQALYRKAVVHFSFEDWSPEGMSERAMEDLRAAARAEIAKLNPKTIPIHVLHASNTIIILTTIFFILLLTISFAICIKSSSRRQDKETEIEIALDAETESIVNELVMKLETNASSEF